MTIINVGRSIYTNKFYSIFYNNNTTPTLGSVGDQTWPPTGYTSLQNASADDANVQVPFPFSFIFNNTSYSSAYVGSNMYVTFGGGSSNYSGLSSSNPAFNKIMFNAADRSYLRIGYIHGGTRNNFVRIRYEGHTTTSGGTLTSPSVVYEMTFYNPRYTDYMTTIELRFGRQDAVGGTSGVYSSTGTDLIPGYTLSAAANQSQVLQATNRAATSFRVYSAYVRGFF